MLARNIPIFLTSKSYRLLAQQLNAYILTALCLNSHNTTPNWFCLVVAVLENDN